MSRKYKSRGTYLYALRRKKYTRYKKEYLRRQERMRKKGLEMYSEMLTSQELEAVYGAFKRKKIENPFHRLLSEQQFKYRYNISLSLKRAAIKHDLSWKDVTLTEIRTGQKVDIAEINELLKQLHPEWDAYMRRDYIREEYFGYTA